MKLFTVGPVEMYPETLGMGDKQLPYFRTSEFSEIMYNIQKNLLFALGAPENSKLAILTASGTGAMEAAVCNALTKDDKVLVISGGSFGERFCEICDCWGIPFTKLIVPFEKELTEDMLEPYNDCGYTALLVNADETSVGKLYDLKMLSNFCKKNDMYFIVDAISTFLSDPLNMSDLNIDITILSSQKGLALSPGLSFVVANEKIVEERIKKTKKRSYYFDLVDYFTNMERGQPPFTPAVGIVLQLDSRLNKIIEQGMDNVIAQSSALAADFRKRCKDISIRIPQFQKTNALTPILFDDGNAKYVFDALKDKYGIYLTPSGGELSKRLLRVGHLGNLTVEDNKFLIEKLKEVL